MKEIAEVSYVVAAKVVNGIVWSRLSVLYSALFKTEVIKVHMWEAEDYRTVVRAPKRIQLSRTAL